MAYTTAQLQNLARRFANRYHVPVNMFMRQINQESGWNPNARSSAGALGIAQIVPKWHPGVDPMDPRASLNYAARLMSSHYSRYGTWRDALSAYNSGRPWAQGRNIDETRNYVSSIMNGLGRLAAGGQPGQGVYMGPSMQFEGPDMRKQAALSLLGGTGLNGPLLAALQSKATRTYSIPGMPGAGPMKGGMTLDELAQRFGLNITSGYRSAAQNKAVGGSPTSFHLTNHARDVAVGSGQWSQFIRFAQNHPGMFREFFYDPLGWYIKNGRVQQGSIGGHGDHLHYAY